MYARRSPEFVYKHRGLALRAAPQVVSSLPGVSDVTFAIPAASAASTPKTSDPVTPPTPVQSTPEASQAQQASASASAAPSPSPSSTPDNPTSAPASASAAASSSPASSASSTLARSSSPNSSSASSAGSSVRSTPLIASPQSTYAPATIDNATGNLFTPTPTLAPSASATSVHSAGGVSTGTIIGAVAGSLAGIALLGVLIAWCMRRQREHDIDDFDAQAFKRQSAMLVDDPVRPPRSYSTRPPTMVENHNASPALAAQSGFGGQNFYGNYDGYGQQAAYPEMAPSSGSALGYPGYDNSGQPIAGEIPNMGYDGYDSQQQLAGQAPNAAYLTRQPNSAAGYAPPGAPPGSNAHYIDLNRSSVSPYQAAQYADISRQLGTRDPNSQVSQRSTGLPDGPLPSPFDDPVGAAPVQSQEATPGLHQRPATVYEEGDAYSGI